MNAIEDSALADKAIEQTVRELNRNGQECALFGSITSGRTWSGSDINVLAIDSGQDLVTSSATNYAFGDWTLDTPRTAKRLVEGRLLEVDGYPQVNLATALDDWILCDRLLGAQPVGEQKGPLRAAIERVRQLRWDPSIRARRVHWYLSTASRLRKAAVEPDEIVMAIRMGAMLLGCAQLEIVGQPKMSYKRLYRQSLSAFDDPGAAADFELCSGLVRGSLDELAFRTLMQEALAALGAMQEAFRDPAALRSCPPRLRVGFVTTLEISAGGVPPGKGIAESLALGDPLSALDSLRKASLWLMNGMLRMRVGEHPAPQSGRYLSALATIELPNVNVAAFARRAFGLAPDAIDVVDAAHGRLVDRLATATLRKPLSIAA